MIRLKSLLPRSLYGRAALILIVPIVTIQLVVSIAFIQRHFDRVTQQMTRGVVIELNLILAEMAGAAPEAAAAVGEATAQALEMDLRMLDEPGPGEDRLGAFDLTGRAVIGALREGLEGLHSVDLVSDRGEVRLVFLTQEGAVGVVVDRKRVSASNPHQLLVLMIVTSVLMTVIAFIFLRNQLRPIKRLAVAADAFGKGRHLAYRPSGATEVRAAGAAFLDMRARIERQIEQRTLMLSAVSHDLRTPLTRLRLGLSLLPEDEETEALQGDVRDMERLVDEFLAFARGDALDAAEITDVQVLVRRVVENGARVGQAVSLGPMVGAAVVRLRISAVQRALENLVGNAVRYGSRAVVSLAVSDTQIRITVEDDGPGIPEDRRDEALLPFARLDTARDPNRGGGAGLGLAIAADIALSHGGALLLGESAGLGGLKAELVLAR